MMDVMSLVEREWGGERAVYLGPLYMLGCCRRCNIGSMGEVVTVRNTAWVGSR